jgi:hypothetical protein
MRLLSCLSVSVFLLAPLASGCTTTQDADTGTLVIPLVQPGADGAIYHLSAEFDIEGPISSFLFVDHTDAPSINLNLSPGLTNVRLHDDWVLTRSTDGGGTFRPVSALLGSQNVQQVRVLANHTDQVVFEFLVRSPNGVLTVTFGVTDHPRELAGGMVIDQGTDLFADYPHNVQVDFATYYKLVALDKDVLTDGSKDRVFLSDATATEFFNDGVGVLSGTVAPSLQGGILQWHLIARLDGSQEISGELDGLVAPFPVVKFGPHTFRFPLPVDDDGFVSDVFFNESIPFSLEVFGQASGRMNGTMRFRNVPVSN